MQPQVLASAAPIYDEKVTKDSYSFICKSPLNTINSMRILLPAAPRKSEAVDDKGNTVTLKDTSWEAVS